MENLRITESIQQNLLSAAKWLKFLTVLGTIGMVLIALIGVVCLFIPSYEGVNGPVIAVIYFVMCALYYYPIKKCYNIVSSTREAMNNDSLDSLELCADNLRSVLKYFGILSIVVMVLYALIIVFAIIAAMAGSTL